MRETLERIKEGSAMDAIVAMTSGAAESMALGAVTGAIAPDSKRTSSGRGRSADRSAGADARPVRDERCGRLDKR